MNNPYKMADLGPVMPPRFFQRIFSVWFRHVRVYTRHLISNGFPPFVEPLMFLAGIGLGLGSYVGLIEGKTYIMFLASGIIVPSAMFTATYECTFGSFIRLEFDKVYDGMISASLTVKDMFIGEILFAGTKGFFFSGAVLAVVAGFGLVQSGMAVFTPFIGFITGMMFAALALFVTSFVKNINHFNFFFTGLITPMFFFSGIVFPLENLPEFARWLAAVFPLMHSVRLVRAFFFNSFDPGLLFNLAYVILFTVFFGGMAINRLTRRIVN